MGRKPTGRPTSFDIAYAAGVSQPTVSRALRGDRSVSQATREKIQQIARDLKYTVDKNASSLRSQRSNTIALLFFEDPTPDASMINPSPAVISPCESLPSGVVRRVVSMKPNALRSHARAATPSS